MGLKLPTLRQRLFRCVSISGSVNANSGTLNNVTINQNCTIKGMLEATQSEEISLKLYQKPSRKSRYVG